MEHMKLKENIESIALGEGLKVILDSDKIDLGTLPNSMEQARGYATFWKAVLRDYSKMISEVTFNYQEKSKEVPLTNFQKLRNYLGANISPREIDGEIKEKIVKPILVNESKGLARIITNKFDWEELNSLSKTTEDFKSPYVMALEPLCYRTIVPLELITKMKMGKKE